MIFFQSYNILFVCLSIGLNNNSNSAAPGGNMIMTNSNMSTMAGMAGGGLVVSSTINKPLTNSANMMAASQSHHPGNHAVPQVSECHLY